MRQWPNVTAAREQLDDNCLSQQKKINISRIVCTVRIFLSWFSAWKKERKVLSIQPKLKSFTTSEINDIGLCWIILITNTHPAYCTSHKTDAYLVKMKKQNDVLPIPNKMYIWLLYRDVNCIKIFSNELYVLFFGTCHECRDKGHILHPTSPSLSSVSRVEDGDIYNHIS